MTISVLVADDQSMVRAGFRMLLAGEEDIDVVAEARTGLEAVEKAARFQPTIVLMDIRMPELVAATVAAARERELLLLSCGLYGNVIRLLPPVTIGDEDLAQGLDALEAALREAAG